MSNKIIILTGDIQTGKTTLLQQFCKGRNDAAGILTPIVNGKRVFYDIAGDSFFNMEADANEETLAVGKYLFSKCAFEQAGNIMLDASKIQILNYLIIDEIGPLEIKHRQGFYQSLQQILSSPYNYTLIAVVRQSLVDNAVHSVIDKKAPPQHIKIITAKNIGTNDYGEIILDQEFALFKDFFILPDKKK
jgi:nucleoside-triphosphatase THEP1